MNQVKSIGCAVMALLFSAVAYAEMSTNNVAKLLEKGEFVLAAEVLREDINSGMSRVDIDVAITSVEKLVAKLRGGDTALAIHKFVPPDKNKAYEIVTSRSLNVKGWRIPASLLKIGVWYSGWAVAWGNDAQRVLVANSYLDRSKLITAEEAQDELGRFDAVTNVVKDLIAIIESRCKLDNDEQDHYVRIKKSINLIKGCLKTKRTRFLSYEVVSPYIFEAHGSLFVGFSDSWRASSLNKAYPELVEEHKIKGIKLLAKSCHQQWLYSCSEDVRDQFVEVQKFMKENIGECEMKEYKVVMTLSDCNDPSKVRGADAWWK